MAPNSVLLPNIDQQINTNIKNGTFSDSSKTHDDFIQAIAATGSGATHDVINEQGTDPAADDDDDEDGDDFAAFAPDVLRDASLSGLPAAQGLYSPDNEKDSCGVGFICHIKGQALHRIVSDARQLLCNMTHRGATGADSRDGDGAGVMVGTQRFPFAVERKKHQA